MENLWPVELLSPLPKTDSGWDVFEAQAFAIRQVSVGLVQGEVRHREVPIGRSSSFFLCPSAQPTKGYEFMAIRSAGEDFPLTLEVFHLGETKRIWQVSDPSELKRVLRKIFAHEATSRIIRYMAQEASRTQPHGSSSELGTLAEEAMVGPDGGEELPSIHSARESSRPIAVGGLIDESGVAFATVNLLGISGFVHEDELRKLAMKPDTKGAAVSLFNGRYVVAVSFMDSVRMALSSDELKVLQSEVRSSLSAGDKG